MKLREPRCDCEHDRLTQRVARLEEQLFAAMERIGTLEAHNAHLRRKNRQLREENARLPAQVQRLGKENTRLEQALATTAVPEAKHARNLAKRFRENGEACFRFIPAPGIDPTNNLAKQAIRFAVIDRHITQGTRSEKGRRWCEWIWTVMATCAQQGRAVFQFLLDSVQAHLCGTPPPSLLPSGP